MPAELPAEALDPISRASRDLTVRFPDTFAGFYPNPDDSYTVLTVGEPGAGVSNAVRREFAELPSEFAAAGFGSSASKAGVPELRFKSAKFPLGQIEDTADSLRPRVGSPGLWGVGLDTVNNQVVLSVTDSAEGRAAADGIVASKPAGIVRVETGPIPKAVVGRFDDSPPWNGGNQIVEPNLGTCTSNFGWRSNATGKKFVFTAGHCGWDSWYNTWNGFPSFTGPNFVGNTTGGQFPFGGGTGIDAQVIDPGANGASCISWGGISNPPYPLVRYYITGWNDVVNGITVRTEGSVGFERTGVVTQHHITFAEDLGGGVLYNVINGFVVDEPVEHGDSGGPVIQPSPYGPLAAGMITATTGTHSYHQHINSLRFAFQANPITSPNGINC